MFRSSIRLLVITSLVSSAAFSQDRSKWTIEDYWKDTQPLFVSTSALHRLTKSLKGLKPLIRSLSRAKLGDLSRKVKEAYQDLCDKQEALLSNPNQDTIRAELFTAERWQRISTIEEKFLKQRSKLHWLQVGDRNNKAFHTAAKVREVRNAIREIKCPSGNVVTSQEEIKAEAERFFKEFLTFEPPDLRSATVEELQEILPFRCSEEERTSLTKLVTEEEIREVLFHMPSNKSPGPDGFTTEFFKASWSVIAKDFTVAVQSFFCKGFLPKGLNSTILALIPKKDIATEMKDYRPISCCNVLYKVISKIIANRLKATLPQCISHNQSAFVKDRLLVENLLLATEIVKDYHKEDITPRCAMKIDIAKAFDSVNWDFLLNTLRALHIPEDFIHWIKLCVCTASFSVQINGELAGFFQSKRGLRQGCALSPYLFVICINVLSRMIDRAAERKQIGFHPRCQNILLTHLCFADDLMVFTDGSKRSIEGVLKVFDEFEVMSGLKISLEKSTLYIAGATVAAQEDILGSFPFASGSLPVRYLGLPLLTKRMTVHDYLPLVEKVRKRMKSWTGRFLSHAGRLQLIKSVITSLTNFWMQAFKLPSSCLKDIERLCSAFLWSGPELKTSKAKVSWVDVCLPKDEGGLGIRPLKEINTVHSLKLIWRIHSAKASLWVKWVQCYLIRKGSFWTIKESTSLGSWVWRKLLKLRDLAKQFYKMEVRNGQNTLFWHDNWSKFGCLKEVLGDRGCIVLGISDQAVVADVLGNQRRRRRRRHRENFLNEVEAEIDSLRSAPSIEKDFPLWKQKEGVHAGVFSSKKTWLQLRSGSPRCEWSKGIWFTQSTPKYSFLIWVALRNRLQTCDRMQMWNTAVNPVCVLCDEANETCSHLFFNCKYSKEVWKELVGGILQGAFTTEWNHLVGMVSQTTLPPTKQFLLRYTFQATVHALWRERNNRRHGETPQSAGMITRFVDKAIRLKLLMVKGLGKKHFEESLITWFGTRESRS